MGKRHHEPDFRAITLGGTGSPMTGKGEVDLSGPGIPDNLVKQQYFNDGTYSRLTVHVDLTGLESSTTLDDIIGGADSSFDGKVANIATIPQEFGYLTRVNMFCAELPAGGVTDIDAYITSNELDYDEAAAGGTEHASGGAFVAGDYHEALAQQTSQGTLVDVSSLLLYLKVGVAGTPGTYTGGKLIIILEGISNQLINRIANP